MKNFSVVSITGLLLLGWGLAHAQVTPMIVGGNNTTIDQQPWQVIVSRGSNNGTGDNSCGGSIIGPNSILTAAHCVNQFASSQVQVYAGTTFLSQRGNGQVRNVTQIILHPGWNPNTFQNDIAILQLDNPLAYNANVQPIRYDGGTGIANPGTVATASGWGLLSQNGAQPNQLQRTNVTIVANANVQAGQYSYTITNDMLPAGGNGTGPCNGDSGGPLWVNNGGQNFLVGVTSFGPTNTCSNTSNPDIFTRVSSYCQWILQQVVNANPISGPGFICNNPGYTYTIPNQPGNTNLSWTSSNTGGLVIGSNGIATRQNNFSGQVVITATLSNNCGSANQVRTVTVGAGTVGGTYTNGGPTYQVQASNGMTLSNSNPTCYINLNNPWGASATYSWQITSQSSSGASLNASGSSASITCSGGKQLSATCTVTTPCGSTQVSFNCYNASGGFRMAAYPNPANDELTIAAVRSDDEQAINDSGMATDKPVEDKDLANEVDATVRLANKSTQVVREGKLKNGKITFSVSDLPNGTYFLRMDDGKKQLDKQIVIEH